MYSLIHRMRVSQLKPQFLGSQHKPGFLRSERMEGAIWLSRALYEQSLHREMLGNHFGEQRRRASGNNPDNPSSFVPYHHRLSIRPAKIPDQGLSLRLRHVWKSWGAGPGNEVAVPSRKEDNRVAFLARSFFSQRHCPWRDQYALALFSAVVAVQTWRAKCLELLSFLTFFGPYAPFS